MKLTRKNIKTYISIENSKLDDIKVDLLIYKSRLEI